MKEMEMHTQSNDYNKTNYSKTDNEHDYSKKCYELLSNIYENEGEENMSRDGLYGKYGPWGAFGDGFYGHGRGYSHGAESLNYPILRNTADLKEQVCDGFADAGIQRQMVAGNQNLLNAFANSGIREKIEDQTQTITRQNAGIESRLDSVERNQCQILLGQKDIIINAEKNDKERYKDEKMTLLVEKNRYEDKVSRFCCPEPAITCGPISSNNGSGSSTEITNINNNINALSLELRGLITALSGGGHGFGRAS